jgi:hypothetical protein
MINDDIYTMVSLAFVDARIPPLFDPDTGRREVKNRYYVTQAEQAA